MYYSTGEQYEGEFVSDNYNGKGTHYLPNGDVYIGDF